VYERLIHVAISKKESAPYLYIKLTFRVKHEPRSIQIIGMETTRSKQQTLVTLVYLVTCIRTYIYRRLMGLQKNNRGIQLLLFALRKNL